MSGDEAVRLSEEERVELDERVAADLWGYYLHFEATGVPSVDRVLSALGLAAKAFHHTENWTDELDFNYGPIPKGETCADLIQRAANDAAHILAARLAERDKAARADELRKAADAVLDECRHSADACFCGSADWLRERADHIERAARVQGGEG